MKTIITIDTGTTNTRATLWQNEKVISKASAPVGVRTTAINGNNVALKKAIKLTIDSVLDKANITDHKGILVLASGMITSNLGLVEIPHIPSPVNIKKLASGMIKKNIPDVFDVPIWFIPGVRNSGLTFSPNEITNADVMRGEEVEALGLVSQINLKNPAILILPGSHTKIIKVNSHGQIVGSITSMTGELLEFFTKQSILANSVDENFTESIDRSALVLGAKLGTDNGLGRAAFSVRLLDIFTNYTRNQRANFLLGAVLSNDLLALKKTKAFPIDFSDQIIISGKETLSESLRILFEEDQDFKESVSTHQVKNLAGLGAIEIAKSHNLISEVNS